MHSDIMSQVSCILECIRRSNLESRVLKEDFEWNGVSEIGSKLLLRFRSGIRNSNKTGMSLLTMYNECSVYGTIHKEFFSTFDRILYITFIAGSPALYDKIFYQSICKYIIVI